MAEYVLPCPDLVDQYNRRMAAEMGGEASEPPSDQEVACVYGVGPAAERVPVTKGILHKRVEYACRQVCCQLVEAPVDISSASGS